VKRRGPLNGGSPGTAKGESSKEPRHGGGGGTALLTLVAPDLFLRIFSYAGRGLVAHQAGTL